MFDTHKFTMPVMLNKGTWQAFCKYRMSSCYKNTCWLFFSGQRQFCFSQCVAVLAAFLGSYRSTHISYGPKSDIAGRQVSFRNYRSTDLSVPLAWGECSCLKNLKVVSWMLASLFFISFWYLISISWIHLFILCHWFLSQTSVNIVPLMHKNVHLFSLIKHSVCLPRANYSSPISPSALQNEILQSGGQLLLISDCCKSCFALKRIL